MSLANFIPTGDDYLRYLPEIILTVVGTLIMLLEVLMGERPKPVLGWLAGAGMVAAIWGAVVAFAVGGLGFQGMVIVDGFATFFRVLVLVVGLLTLVSSVQYLDREKANAGEFHALLLFSIAGQCVMVSANELIMIFIGLEISSIASYILAGYLRDDRRNNESALKYFLLGSFATAFLLYGIAWIYGVTATTNLAEIRRTLMTPEIAPSMVLVGTSAALMFVGFAFKISAAPFQIWAPDVYQGASAPVAAFMSTGPKAAAFAILLRVYFTAFGPIAKPLGAFHLGIGHRHHGGRQFRRFDADEYQAPTGLQLDCARRLRAGGGRGAFRDRHFGRDVLSRSVRPDADRFLHGDHVFCPAGRKVR